LTKIDGKAEAAKIIERVKSATADLAAKTSVRPGLAVVIVGADPASQVYVKSKGKMARACGLNSYEHALPENSSEASLLELIGQLNDNEAVHGILVQLPLPAHLNEHTIIQAIKPEKDVDGLNEINMGRLAAGRLNEAFIPCTPAGCMVLIRNVLGADLSGKSAVIVGRSILVGKPVAALLLAANATITMAHSRTKNLAEVCARADIVVAAVGRAQMIKADWIKPGATVIDVGINRIDAPERGEGKTRLVGDVDYGEVEKVAAAITPVPGGVGPMTIAMLMANTLRAAYIKAGQEPVQF